MLCHFSTTTWTSKNLITVNMPTRNSVMDFLFESFLQEVSEQLLISCALLYSFGKQKENKLGQQILYFSLCLNIQIWGQNRALGSIFLLSLLEIFFLLVIVDSRLEFQSHTVYWSDNVAVKSSSGECNITVWLLINLFILLVKHGGRVVLSVSNRNQFVLSVTSSHSMANHFCIMGQTHPSVLCWWYTQWTL